MSPKRIGITVGDPNGIGPEVVIKSLVNIRIPDGVRVRVYGPHESMRNWAHAWHVHEWDSFSESNIEWVDLPWELSWTTYGEAHARAGQWVYEMLVRAINDAQMKEIQALVTAPIIKASLAKASIRWIDHTTLLAHEFQCPAYFSLIHNKIRVMFFTSHIPLRNVPEVLNKDSLVQAMGIFARELSERFGINNPMIGVSGINPHAGENGSLGNEEQTIISPAVREARKHFQFAHFEGPYPAETLFRVHMNGSYDGILMMYHDQGTVAMKALAFGKAVNYTMGLPIIRVSPDHGAGLDIAGKGIADPQGMTTAMKLALSLL